jgi:hypothetical protein
MTTLARILCAIDLGNASCVLALTRFSWPPQTYLPQCFTHVPSKAREGDACIPTLPNHHGFNQRLIYL